MNNKIRLVTGVSLVLALSLLAGCNRSNDSESSIASPNPFPDKTGETTFIQKYGKSNITRIVKYAGDGSTPVEESMVFPDGTERLIYYRPDFKVWRMLEFYPAGEGETKGVLKSEAVLDDSGKGYLSHTVWNENGVRIRRGTRLDDGRSYQTVYFQADGNTLSRRLTYGPTGEFELDELFSADGLLVQTERVYKKSYNNIYRELTYYDASGNTPSRRLTTNDTSWESNRLEVFFPGSDKLRLDYKLNKDGLGGTVVSFNEAREKLRQWTVSRDRITVEVYAASGKVLYRQTWVRADKSPQTAGAVMSFVLETVEELDYVDASDSTIVSRTFEFEPGADRPHRVRFGKSGYSYEQKLQVIDQYGQIVKTGLKRNYGSEELKDVEEPFDLAPPLDPVRLRFEQPELVDTVGWPALNTREVDLRWMPKPPPPPAPEPDPDTEPDKETEPDTDKEPETDPDTDPDPDTDTTDDPDDVN